MKRKIYLKTLKEYKKNNKDLFKYLCFFLCKMDGVLEKQVSKELLERVYKKKRGLLRIPLHICY
jgi:hypothetical protein